MDESVDLVIRIMHKKNSENNEQVGNTYLLSLGVISTC